MYAFSAYILLKSKVVKNTEHNEAKNGWEYERKETDLLKRWEKITNSLKRWREETK